MTSAHSWTTVCCCWVFKWSSNGALGCSIMLCSQRLNHFTTEPSVTQYLERAPSCELRDGLQIWNQLKCYKLWYDFNVMSWQLLTSFSVSGNITVVPQSHNVIKETQFSSSVYKKKHLWDGRAWFYVCYHAGNICKACTRTKCMTQQTLLYGISTSTEMHKNHMHICSTCSHFEEYLEDLVRKYCESPQSGPI